MPDDAAFAKLLHAAEPQLKPIILYANVTRPGASSLSDLPRGKLVSRLLMQSSPPRDHESLPVLSKTFTGPPTTAERAGTTLDHAMAARQHGDAAARAFECPRR